MASNFKRSEFACKCGCGFDTVDHWLVLLLEDIRAHFDKPVIVTSGCRCPTYNKAIKGSVGSQHVRGRAADIQVKDVPPSIVAEAARLYLPRDIGGIGVYDTFTHVDTRRGRAEWEE